MASQANLQSSNGRLVSQNLPTGTTAHRMTPLRRHLGLQHSLQSSPYLGGNLEDEEEHQDLSKSRRQGQLGGCSLQAPPGAGVGVQSVVWEAPASGSPLGGLGRSAPFLPPLSDGGQVHPVRPALFTGTSFWNFISRYQVTGCVPSRNLSVPAALGPEYGWGGPTSQPKPQR